MVAIGKNCGFSHGGALNLHSTAPCKRVSTSPPSPMLSSFAKGGRNALTHLQSRNKSCSKSRGVSLKGPGPLPSACTQLERVFGGGPPIGEGVWGRAFVATSIMHSVEGLRKTSHTLYTSLRLLTSSHTFCSRLDNDTHVAHSTPHRDHNRCTGPAFLA